MMVVFECDICGRTVKQDCCLHMKLCTESRKSVIEWETLCLCVKCEQHFDAWRALSEEAARKEDA